MSFFRLFSYGLFAASVSCLLSLVPLPLWAAGDFTVSPIFQEVNIERGASEAKFTVEITNETTTEVTFRITAEDFGTLDESGGVAFLGKSAAQSERTLADWIELASPSVVVPAKQTSSVQAVVKNRDDLGPGGHYGAIVLTVEGATTQNDGTVSVNPSFSSLVFVKKEGGERYALNLEGRELHRNFLGLPTRLTLRFRNDGNLHATPRGVITVADPAGRLVSRGTINIDSGIILPEAFRRYPVDMQATENAFIPGMYRLVTEFRYDGKEAFETTHERIFVFPVMGLGIILVTLLLLIGTVYAPRIIRRRFLRNRNNS